MTTKRSFKRVVRARMAKTGERYAAARRALLAAEPSASLATDAAADPAVGYRYRGGQQPLSAPLANILADRGVRSPIDGEPLSEATILGIGGGLGAGYILWEFKKHDGATLVLGFVNRWQYPGVPGWTGTTLDRLGVRASVHETAGAVGARAALDGLLDAGRSTIAWVDQQAIGTWGQPAALSGYSGYPVVVTGRTGDGDYLVDDRGRTALRVDAATMAAARGRITSYKHRLIDVDVEPGPLPVDAFRAAVRAGIEDQVAHLRQPSDSFSLPAWRKWSRLLTDQRNAKAWPRVFADGRGLFGTLLSIVEAVDADVGATGGHLRDLYATSLDEAAGLLDVPALTDAAAAWREAADLWEDLADAAVPPTLTAGLDAVEAAERLRAAVMDGEPGRAAARAAARELWALRDANVSSLDLDEAGRLALFEDLSARVAAILDAERYALDRTAAAIGR